MRSLARVARSNAIQQSLAPRAKIASSLHGLSRSQEAFRKSTSLLQHSRLSFTSASLGQLRSSLSKQELPQQTCTSISRTSDQLRSISTKPNDRQAQTTTQSTRSYQDDLKDNKLLDEDDTDVGQGFRKSDKASAAAQINLAAKLRSDGSKQAAGWGEIVRLLRIARPEAKPLAVAVTFLLISSSISMSLPFSIGKILDIATKPEATTLFGLDLNTFYLGLGGLLTLGAAANFGRIIVLRIVGERVVTRLRSQLFRRTMVQDAEFFDANRVGDLISRLGSDTIIVGKSITQNVSDGLRSFVSAAAGFTLMSYVSLKLTGVLALLFPPVAIGAFFYGRAIRTLSRRIQKALGSLTKIAEERLGNVRTSQAFAGETQEVHRYNRQVRQIFNLGKREAVISAVFFSSSGFMGNMTFLALLWFGGGMVKSGAISVGDLTSFLMYTAYAGSSLFGLSGFYSELMKGVGAASRLFELQDREPTISPTKGLPVKSAQGDIEFKDVSFAYPTRPAVEIFKDLNFTIKQGTNIAIVAPSGAGKSTVASLIMRFYSPTGGQILVGGTDISQVNAKQLRRKIGFVGQEPVLFSGSIAENIAYGRPNATTHEIVTAARKANCQFISDFVGPHFPTPPITLLTYLPARRSRNPSRLPRHPALRRSKTAHCHRPRPAQEPRHSNPRRSHLGARR